MSLSMYQASVPPAIQTLRALKAILGKAQAHCDARQIDPNAFLQSRLFPDMFPLTRQVQIACDMVKGAAARLAGAEVPAWADTETTFAELQARISKTLDWLATVPAASIDGREDADITFPVGRDKTRTMKGEAYLKHWALPNLFFHVTTAYALLRHNGVDLGKADYLMGEQAGA